MGFGVAGDLQVLMVNMTTFISKHTHTHTHTHTHRVFGVLSPQRLLPGSAAWKALGLGNGLGLGLG